MIFTSLFPMCAVLAALVTPAAATPTPAARDVWAPKVLYPHAGTTWYRGQVHNVTWDLSSAPAHITNKHFEIFLCREVGGQVEWMPLVLADQLDPRAGHAEVTVPWVMNGNYSVNVWGDSGNVGSFFQILGGFDPNAE